MSSTSEFINEYGRELVEATVAIFTAYLLYTNKQRKMNLNSFPQLINAQEDVINRLSKEILNLNKELVLYKTSDEDKYKEEFRLTQQIIKLQKEIAKKYVTISAFQDFCHYIPTPTWMKYPNLDGNFSKMCFINKAYADEWNIAQLSYKNKTDDEIWPDSIAHQFAKHDYEVSTKFINIITYEKVPTIPYESVSETNPVNDWVIWKFPIIVDDNLKGVGGMAIRLNT